MGDRDAGDRDDGQKCELEAGFKQRSRIDQQNSQCRDAQRV